MESNLHTGLIVLFGSGETSPSGRKVFETVLRGLPMPPQIALLETPAGFEPNSDRVIGRVTEFLQHHLQNYKPQVSSIPARQRGTPFSPDEPEIVAPLLQADMIFMGPGSPTYTARQLRGSLAWDYLLARHQLGAALVLASAAAIAMSSRALPVYEIYKVGEDLHWKDGLNFFGPYGMDLVFVPHWNNTEGGEELDTSRCFMGQERFTRLMAMLPNTTRVIGLDETTALVMDLESGTGQVIGAGGVTVLHGEHVHASYAQTIDEDANGLSEVNQQRGGHGHYYRNGESFPLSEIGPFHSFPPGANLPPEIWQRARQAAMPDRSELASEPPTEVVKLIKARKAARANKEWDISDSLRQQILALGWEVKDTRDGMDVERVN
jgi:cyanophycinase-like exopeptidase